LFAGRNGIGSKAIKLAIMRIAIERQNVFSFFLLLMIDRISTIEKSRPVGLNSFIFDPLAGWAA